MLETIKAVIALLSPASVTLKDIQPKLGPVVEFYPNNTHIRPKDPDLSHIDVVQEVKSDQVYVVDLVLAEPIALTELQSAFGDYHIDIPDKGENQAIFMIRQPNEATDIALIATLNRKGTETTTITLRRDVRSAH